MANLNGRKVQNLRMHTGYHVQGLGSVPTTLDTGKLAKWKKDLSITMEGNGYLCTAKDEFGRLCVFFIEGTNVIGATLEPEMLKKDA